MINPIARERNRREAIIHESRGGGKTLLANKAAKQWCELHPMKTLLIARKGKFIEMKYDSRNQIFIYNSRVTDDIYQ